MNWFNLKKNVCPKCNKDFMEGLMTYPTDSGQTLAHPCGFKISEQRFKEIVSGMVDGELENNRCE